MDQNSTEGQLILIGEVVNEFQTEIKQEKEVVIGDTELHQMQILEWSLSDGDKADMAIHNNLNLDSQCEDRQTCSGKNSYYTILHDIRKTECLECGKVLSGTRKANIKRHYKLVHKRDIQIGRERRSSDEEYADQSSLNDIHRETIQDNGKSYDFQTEMKLGDELIIPDTDQHQYSFQSVEEKPDIKVHNQSDDRTMSSGKYSCYMSYFTILKDIKKTECLECGKQLSGTRISNIQRHYRLVHKKIIDNGRDASSSSDEDYAEPPSKRPKSYNSFSINIDESKFLKCCVGLVAVRDLPLRIFDDRDFFKTLISPYEKKFGTNLNSSNIVSVLDTSAAKIYNRIKKRIKNKMISLKIDIATKTNKGLFGINIQYLKDFKVCCNTLGVLQLDKEHQETTLKDKILKCLASYEIATCQIYSITTDYGANAVKTSELLPDFRDDSTFGDINHAGAQSATYVFNDLGNIDERALEEGIHNSLASVMQPGSCAAHAIHMAAYDVLKVMHLELVQCRDVVKKLRTSLRSSEIEIKLPVLDSARNWYSTYKMLKSLLSVKSDVCTLYFTNWDFVTDFVIAFDPLVKCIEQLENDQYIAGDFYRDWFSCELELEDLVSTTSYAKLLHEAMQNKRKILFQNVAFISALFLDPRFNFLNSVMLSEEQKNRAVAHLVRTFEMIQQLENSQSQCEQSESMTEYPDPTVETFTEETSHSERAYAKMAKHIASLVAMTTKSSETQRTIKQKLISLSNCKMVPIHTDILQYFKYTMVDVDISKIIDVVMAVPVNQLSVERTYSALEVTLTKPNPQLTNTSLHNLLITKLNLRELNSKHVQLEYSDA